MISKIRSLLFSAERWTQQEIRVELLKHITHPEMSFEWADMTESDSVRMKTTTSMKEETEARNRMPMQSNYRSGECEKKF